MKTLTVSEAVYEKLTAYVIDPFQDNADTVLQRLMDLADSALAGMDHADDAAEPAAAVETAAAVEAPPPPDVPPGTRVPTPSDEDASIPL